MPYAVGQLVRVAVGPIGASRKILGRISSIRFNVVTYDDPSDVEQVMEVYVSPEMETQP